MRALLIIDVQNDFLAGGALPVPQGDEIIPVINQMQSQFECVIATKDWHPKNHISFASRHQKKMGERVLVGHQWQELWPDHCVQGTWGSEFPSELETTKIEKIFYKGIDTEIDSYSGFFDQQHLRSTGLAEYLKVKKISELCVVGLALDYCVKWTALDAKASGFDVEVYLPGCRGIELKAKDCDRAIDEMQRAGIRITH